MNHAPTSGTHHSSFITHPLLQAHDVHFAYEGTKREVVRGASLEIQKGKLVALIGANGSGKSTLVRLLAGIRQAQRGTITLEGQSFDVIDARTRAARLGYVPQTTNTVFPFTALEVVLTGRSPYTNRFRFENRRDIEIAHDALRAVEAAHLAARSVTELSGGERQLVYLARALAQQASLLLLDEPAAALDLKHRAGLMRHLRRVRDERGLAALVVMHDLSLLDPTFDEILGMRDGRIIARGTPSEVLRDATLAEIFDDAGVRARRFDNRTFVWSEAG
ncbi:MAG: ABC transporter ATP-binding protein [Pyrinomonadaceae bacterium MAG19_C2-C3]|nr:ABC transporter ATP-binding protein [Pyrinomonadaceae bacterium MAG19_C2-C3]